MKFLLPFGKNKPDRWSDEKLLTAFKNEGAEHYFNILFERHHALVYAWCLKWVKQREDSKDLTLIIFEHLFEMAPLLEIRDFSAWLYTVTKNRCMSHHRKEQRLAIQNKMWATMKKKLPDFVEIPDFDRHTNKYPILEEAMKTLSDGQTTCIALFYEESMSYKEIATITGYSEKEVKSHLQNGKRRLQNTLPSLIKKHSNG